MTKENYIHLSNEEKVKLTVKQLNTLILDIIPDYKSYVRNKQKAIYILDSLISLENRHNAFKKMENERDIK